MFFSSNLFRYVEQRTQVRRSRRLVISSIATTGNYEYGYFWYFQQDGAIHFEVKLTGIIAPGECINDLYMQLSNIEIVLF